MKELTMVQKAVKWLQEQGVSYVYIVIILLLIGFGYNQYNITKTVNEIKESQEKQADVLADLNGLLISDKIEMMRLEFADCENLDDARERINFWIDNKWTAQIASAKLVCNYAQDELKDALFPPETADVICKAVR